MSRCVSPARSNASLSDASSEGSSAGYSDLLANSQIGGSRSRGNSSSPATSHGSRSSTEGSSAAAPELEHLRESSKQRVRKHGKSNSRPPPPSWAGGVAVAPQHEPDRAHLIEYDTVQLIHRLAALLHNITKTNDGLRPLHSPGTDSASSTSFSPGASGCQVDTPGALQTPELAQTSLARCTPHEEGPSTAWPEQSSSHQGPQDYFSLHPQRHPYKKRGSPSSSSMSPTKEHALPPRTPGGEIPDMTGAKIAYNSRNPTICFQARNIPAISIEQYLLRIQKYCPTTNEVYIALLIYFDRLTCMHATYASSSAPKFALDSYNVHRLLIAGLAIGSKFLSDIFYTNSRYAKVGGLPLAEFNQLELQMLMLLDFHLGASSDHILKYANALLLSDESEISNSKPTPATATSSVSSSTSGNTVTAPAHLDRDHDRPASRNSVDRASSESGSSTIGGRSDCSSVCSTGTVVHAPSLSQSSSSTFSTDAEDSPRRRSMDVDEETE